MRGLIGSRRVPPTYGLWCPVSKAVLERYAALRCLWHEMGVRVWPMAYGLWPMTYGLWPMAYGAP
eukprot:2730454-Prymnesium_polylepis.1